MTDPERDRSVHGMASTDSEPYRSRVQQQLESSLADLGHRDPDGEACLGAEKEEPRSAVIRVATELYKGETEALQATLERHFGGPLNLQIELDPSILGGVWVRVGDTVIDGSLRSRLGRIDHRDVPRKRAHSLLVGRSMVRLGEPGPILSVDGGPAGSGRTRPRHGVIVLASHSSEPEVGDLQAALEAYFGSPLVLEVEVDPSVLGGAWVQVEGTVIDGSVRGRLEALRDHLRAQCRAMYSADAASVRAEAEAKRSV